MAGNPIAENPLVAAEGLANLAHAVRRSTAMYVAMQITAPEDGMEGMLANFEVIAARIGGRAATATTAPSHSKPPQGDFLGQNPWEPQ